MAVHRPLLQRLSALQAHDFRDFARAQLAILTAHWLLWRRPYGELVARDASPASAAASVAAPLPPGVARLARAVNRASLLGLTRPLCLTRAVALMRLLEADGYRDGVMRIGVRWRDGAFIAHAWVDYRGTVLDLDARLHETFTPLTDVAVLPAGSRQ